MNCDLVPPILIIDDDKTLPNRFPAIGEVDFRGNETGGWRFTVHLDKQGTI